MRSTSRSPATPVDVREWLPSHVVSGSDDDEIEYHSSWTRRAPTAAGTHATPDAADVDPEADTDTSVPTHPPYILDRPLRIITNAHPNPTRANSQLSFAAHGGTLGSAHTQASPPSPLPLPPFQMGAHAEPFESAHSSPLSRSRSPLSSSPTFIKDSARLGGGRSRH
ncbi:hypothetical protein BGW80DRAFT_1541699 [Lactifluus volemus]|nr:hypothetical protein BGW80DRAFT_1541699 [Lactifluus volemus]